MLNTTAAKLTDQYHIRIGFQKYSLNLLAPFRKSLNRLTVYSKQMFALICVWQVANCISGAQFVYPYEMK
jgi:hypothetical protein